MIIQSLSPLSSTRKSRKEGRKKERREGRKPNQGIPLSFGRELQYWN